MFRCIYSVFLGFCLFFPTQTIAQTGQKEVSVQYNNAYQLERSYTILYDNVSEPAKLKTFKIRFFGPDNALVGETEVETYPVTAKITVYKLPHPIIGFNAIKLNVLSLHSGDISSLPSGFPMLALNEDNIIEEIPPEVKTPNETSPAPIIRPPEARRASFDIQAGTEQIFNLGEYYSGFDGQTVTLSEKSGEISGLSYHLANDGTLNVSAPAKLGQYEIPYEVKDPSGGVAISHITITSIVPGALSAALSAEARELEGLGSRLGELENVVAAHGANQAGRIEAANNLLGANKELSRQAKSKQNTSAKTDIDALSEEITQSLPSENAASALAALIAKRQAYVTELANIQAAAKGNSAQLSDLTFRIDALSSHLASLNKAVDKLESQSAPTQAQLQTWQARHQSLAAQTMPTTKLPLGLILLMTAGLIAAGVYLFKKQTGKLQTDIPLQIDKARQVGLNPQAAKFSKPKILKENNIFEKNGASYKIAMSFPASSSALARLQPTPAHPPLNPLSGADEKSSYRPVGRIGQAWGTTPLKDDFSLGTGLLISDRHVVTNWHVFKFYGKYLQAGFLQSEGHDIKCLGIEFMAYAENADRPDLAAYLSFDGNPPKVLPGLDLVVYTLAEPVDPAIKERITLTIAPISTKAILDRNIELVGHPAPFDFPSDGNEQVDNLAFGKDPVFAVKRVSKGTILSPSSLDSELDNDAPLMFDHGSIGSMEVVCHNASTLGGGSGSPLIDPKTNELLGIHFRCVPDFYGQDVNLAMPVSTIIKAIERFLPQA